jgi:hypothetical protein
MPPPAKTQAPILSASDLTGHPDFTGQTLEESGGFRKNPNPSRRQA